MKNSADKKLMNQVAKIIEERINKSSIAKKNFDLYGVKIDVNYDTKSIEVSPATHDALFCIEELVSIARWYGKSAYVTIEEGKPVFRMTSFFK